MIAVAVILSEVKPREGSRRTSDRFCGARAPRVLTRSRRRPMSAFVLVEHALRASCHREERSDEAIP